MNPRQKKIIKMVLLVMLLVVLTGCARNLGTDGKLLPERAITVDTPWSLKAGIFDFLFVIPLAKLILILEPMMGVTMAVVVTTIILNLITLPFMIKSTVSSQKMQMIQGKVQQIQRKYKGRENDRNAQMRMSNELNALYKKHGISMGASFVPFLTLPIMLAMYHAVQRITILYDATFLGINLGDTPMAHVTNFEINYIVLIVILAICQFFSVQISQILLKRKKGYRPNPQMEKMQTMNIMMLVMIVWVSLTLPSAMSLYWITTSVIAIARSIFIDIKYKDIK